MALDSSTTFYCLFEQSGTFKRAFNNLGFGAFDVDILNDFGCTDYRLDLFAEIDNAYLGNPSFFDWFKPDRDFLLAFFPCVRFSKMSNFEIIAYAAQCKKMDLGQRLDYSMKHEAERSRFYQILCRLCVVCFRLGLRLIIENPYSNDSYLTRYFPILPGFIDRDRTRRGDWFVKPTQWFFVNCSPAENFIFETLPKPPRRKVDGLTQVEKSLISPVYADRFIREFIL